MHNLTIDGYCVSDVLTISNVGFNKNTILSFYFRYFMYSLHIDYLFIGKFLRTSSACIMYVNYSISASEYMLGKCIVLSNLLISSKHHILPKFLLLITNNDTFLFL